MRWYLEEAACLGANPKLFDRTSGETVIDALSYCERCTVTKECEDLVRPRRSHYDGVAGGKVWREGRVVKQDTLFD